MSLNFAQHCCEVLSLYVRTVVWELDRLQLQIPVHAKVWQMFRSDSVEFGLCPKYCCSTINHQFKVQCGCVACRKSKGSDDLLKLVATILEEQGRTKCCVHSGWTFIVTSTEPEQFRSSPIIWLFQSTSYHKLCRWVLFWGVAYVNHHFSCG